jgi:hypothetical protein
MSTATIATIGNQVKLDLLSKTQTTDNAIQRKEISRTFICEPQIVDEVIIMSALLYPLHLADTVTG